MTAKEAREKAIANFRAQNRDIMDAIHKAVKAGDLEASLEIKEGFERYLNVSYTMSKMGYGVSYKEKEGKPFILIINF